MSRHAVQRLRQLEDHVNRLNPKRREAFYLRVDPLQYEKALDLLRASEKASQALEDEERPSTPLEAGEKELTGPANNKE